MALRGPLALEGASSQNETILPVSFYENPVKVVVKRIACWQDGVELSLDGHPQASGARLSLVRHLVQVRDTCR